MNKCIYININTRLQEHIERVERKVCWKATGWKKKKEMECNNMIDLREISCEEGRKWAYMEMIRDCGKHQMEYFH
jgi:hypothetical protein